MRTLMGEGNPDMPDLLGGSFGDETANGGRRSALAVIAIARGVVTKRDSLARGGSSGSSGGTGGGSGGGGTFRPPVERPPTMEE